MSHLTDFFKVKPKAYKLTFEAVEANKQLKQKLAQAPTLMYQNSHSPLDLTVDVSGREAGGTLNQLVKKAWKQIYFFSTRLVPAETRCSTFERELPIYLTVKHFRHMLGGREFLVFTDH